MKHINADHVEQMVVQKLSELSRNETILKMTVEELNRDPEHKTKPLTKEAERIDKRLKQIEQETGRYVRALGQGKLSIRRLEAEIHAFEDYQATVAGSI